MTRGPGSPRPWRVDFALEAGSSTPLFLQLVHAVVRDIRRGRLGPGDPLPGSRSLAQALGVTRKTVVTALDELVAQGWLTTSQARGTYVSAELPLPIVADALPERREGPRSASMPGRPRPPGLASPSIVFGDGLPDPRMAPLQALARGYRRALLELAQHGLGDGDPRGEPRLREVLASLLNQARGLAIAPEQVMVTRGSQMALLLAAIASVERTECIAVEDPGYRPAWDAFRLAGAELAPIPVDREGIRVDALAALVATRPVRAVYVTPHHQYPTTVALAPTRRLQLLELAEAHGFTIIEDDYDYEYYFEGRPPLPLASTNELRSVLYIGSLSKLLAPGIRVGYLVAPAALIDRAARVRAVVDRQGDPALERAVAELIEDGELQRHARKARRAYQERRDALAEALATELSGSLSFSSPPGGLALWANTRSDLDVDAWVARAAEAGIAITPGRAHAFRDRPLGGVRLGYAALTPAELRKAARALRTALPTA